MMPCTFPKVKSNYVIDWKEASLIQTHYQSIIVFTILGSCACSHFQDVNKHITAGYLISQVRTGKILASLNGFHTSNWFWCLTIIVWFLFLARTFTSYMIRRFAYETVTFVSICCTSLKGFRLSIILT